MHSPLRNYALSTIFIASLALSACGDHSQLPVASDSSSNIQLKAGADEISLFLVDTDTDEILLEVVDGQRVPLDLVDGRLIGVVAEPGAALTVRSVKLSLNGGSARTENVAPYALFGDTNGDYFDGTRLQDGTHVVAATAYALARGAGQPVADTQVSFSVDANATAPVTESAPASEDAEQVVSSPEETNTGAAETTDPVETADPVDVSDSNDSPVLAIPSVPSSACVNHGFQNTFNPPALQNPITIDLSRNEHLVMIEQWSAIHPRNYAHNVFLSNSQDYIITASAPLTHPIGLTGGRNVRIVGIEVAPVVRSTGGPASGLPGTLLQDERVNSYTRNTRPRLPFGSVVRAMDQQSLTIEGSVISVNFNEADTINTLNGYRGNAWNRANKDLYVVNSRLVGGYSSTPLPPRADGRIHADVWQNPNSAFRHFRAENVQIQVSNQGITLQNAADISTNGGVSALLRNVSFERIPGISGSGSLLHLSIDNGWSLGTSQPGPHFERVYAGSWPSNELRYQRLNIDGIFYWTVDGNNRVDTPLAGFFEGDPPSAIAPDCSVGLNYGETRFR